MEELKQQVILTLESNKSCVDFYYLVNKSKEEIEKAFFDSEKLTGLSWSKSKKSESGKDLTIFVHENCNFLDENKVEILKRHGIDILSTVNNDNDGYKYISNETDSFGVYEAPKLLIAFIKLTLPDLIMIDCEFNPNLKKENKLKLGRNIGNGLFETDD